MTIKNLPTDIDAEVLLDYYPEGTFNIEFKGLHKRNTYMDILSLEDGNDRMQMSLGRNSLYNSLPEFLFHPIDRFDLPQYNQKERFEEEYIKQEQEKENAYKFFAPVDLALLLLKIKVKHEFQELSNGNKVLIDILSDTLSDKQKNNKFIKQSLCFLPYCKIIRGDRALITFMLRKVLMKENLVVNISKKEKSFSDKAARYSSEVDSELTTLYVGTDYTQNILCYDVHYWNEEECNECFTEFIEDLDEYRTFVQDFFLAIESELEFKVYHDAPALRLSDTTIYNYLNYNTNI